MPPHGIVVLDAALHRHCALRAPPSRDRYSTFATSLGCLKVNSLPENVGARSVTCRQGVLNRVLAKGYQTELLAD